jgi:hypothetical protein
VIHATFYNCIHNLQYISLSYKIQDTMTKSGPKEALFHKMNINLYLLRSTSGDMKTAKYVRFPFVQFYKFFSK